MLKSKRTLSLALALLLLGGSLVSCASGTDDPIDTGSQTTAAEEDENIIKDNLPAGLNYGGDTITFSNAFSSLIFSLNSNTNFLSVTLVAYAPGVLETKMGASSS